MTCRIASDEVPKLANAQCVVMASPKVSLVRETLSVYIGVLTWRSDVVKRRYSVEAIYFMSERKD